VIRNWEIINNLGRQTNSLTQLKDLSMKVLLFTLVTGLFILIAGFKINQEPKPWVAPDAAAKKANPVKTSSESVSAGKALWNQHCSSCHGKTGLGDGSKAAQLKTHPGDFSAAAFQSQSDGSIFYKIEEGRGDMPSFKKKIPEAADVWDLVNYMRTFKK
jgi:mono/diheme cytochrome c family protein